MRRVRVRDRDLDRVHLRIGVHGLDVGVVPVIATLGWNESVAIIAAVVVILLLTCWFTRLK